VKIQAREAVIPFGRACFSISGDFKISVYSNTVAIEEAVKMKTKKAKPVKKAKTTEIICGTPEHIQEAFCELDQEKQDMHVVWTSAGFWALPKK